MGLPSINNTSLITGTNKLTASAPHQGDENTLAMAASLSPTAARPNSTSLTIDLQATPEIILIEVLDQSLTDEFSRAFSREKLAEVTSEFYSSPKTLEQVENRVVGVVSQQLYYGERDGHDFSAMDETVNAVSQALQDGYLGASDILNGLGMLDETVSEYLQKSHTRLTSDINSLKNDYQNGVNRGYDSSLTRRDSFSLQVKTSDGDVINIDLMYADEREPKNEYSTSVLAREISVSYKVEGDLSKKEKEALNDLMKGLGALADRFFAGKGDLTELSDLDVFDQGELSSYSLSLKDYKDKEGEGLQTLLVEYSVNQHLSERSLTALYEDQTDVGEKGTDNYKLNITSSLQAAGFDLFPVDGQGNMAPSASNKLELLENQIDFSVDQLNEKDTQAAAFYMSGLRKMLGGALDKVATQNTVAAILPDLVQVSAQLFKGIVQKHPEYHALAQPEKQHLDQVLSGLPDFSAEFSAKREFLDTRKDQRDMTLSLGQKTEIEQYQSINGFTEDIEQTDTFKLDINQQELRKQGAQRVVEHIAIDRDAKRTAEYSDGELIAQYSQEKQSVERKVTNFFEDPVSYITKDRVQKSLNVMSEEASFIHLIREMDQLFNVSKKHLK